MACRMPSVSLGACCSGFIPQDLHHWVISTAASPGDAYSTSARPALLPATMPPENFKWGQAIVILLRPKVRRSRKGSVGIPALFKGFMDGAQIERPVFTQGVEPTAPRWRLEVILAH